MVVAAGAGDGEAEERTAHDIDFIVHVVGDHLILIDIAGHEVGNSQQAGGDQTILIDASGLARRDQIPRDLIAQELGVGEVLVERLDDPIAVAPRLAEVALRRQLNEISGIGVAHDIEPVPTPALAIQRRCEHAIHDPREGLGRFIGEERLDLGGCRRQADKVERRSAQERPFVGRRGGGAPLRFQLREDEIVGCIERPFLIADGRQSTGLDRLEGPKAPLLLGDGERTFLDRAFHSPRPDGAFFHPALEDDDLLGGQLPGRRHVEFVAIAHRLHNKAFVGLAGHGGRAVVAAFQELHP